MSECKWCGEEGHEPAEVTLGCCGSTEMRCNGPGIQEHADQDVCRACDDAADERHREDDRRAEALDRYWEMRDDGMRLQRDGVSE